MKITLITVGKIKEKYLKDAIAEYSKRLSRYCKLEIAEVADEKTPDQAGETVEENIRNKEGERILKCIHDDMYVITLEINGVMDQKSLQGRSNSSVYRETAVSALSSEDPLVLEKRYGNAQIMH